jgi:hypothetical protein
MLLLHLKHSVHTNHMNFPLSKQNLHKQFYILVFLGKFYTPSILIVITIDIIFKCQNIMSHEAHNGVFNVLILVT